MCTPVVDLLSMFTFLVLPFVIRISGDLSNNLPNPSDNPVSLTFSHNWMPTDLHLMCFLLSDHKGNNPSGVIAPLPQRAVSTGPGMG